jgi:hypothetical protein
MFLMDIETRDAQFVAFGAGQEKRVGKGLGADARPYKSSAQNRFAVENTEGA